RRWDIYSAKQDAIAAEQRRLDTVRLKASAAAATAIEAQTGAPIKGSISLAELLRRPGFHSEDLARHGLADPQLPRDVAEAVEIEIKYSGYLARQQQQIDQVQRQQQRPIPVGVDYGAIGTLSREAREKLAAIQPTSLGQASRLPGVSPADLTALLLWLELQRRRQQGAAGPADSPVAPRTGTLDRPTTPQAAP
ncbi:MAG: tRNA uridine-5-carboxymethylaminomethyl(34) synthesis enzyme MnmG, partial [Synechococcaceae cyanobacterium]|nr:tRNA uridine-5-carboxymethylaminomethyl(34) synthesis enzyme MnmG [Synechococcaceae cyanobacterium]